MVEIGLLSRAKKGGWKLYFMMFQHILENWWLNNKNLIKILNEWNGILHVYVHILNSWKLDYLEG